MVKQAITTVMDLLAERRIDRETARLLVQALQQEDDRAPAQAAPLDQGFEPVAVIGVAAELPGAESYDDFWRLLMDSADQVGPLPPRRRELCAPVLPAADAQPEFLTGAWLDDIDRFDAEFFSITPAEARTMDPQHRRFIQVAYHCLEDAGWAGRIRGTPASMSPQPEATTAPPIPIRRQPPCRAGSRPSPPPGSPISTTFAVPRTSRVRPVPRPWSPSTTLAPVFARATARWRWSAGSRSSVSRWRARDR